MKARRVSGLLTIAALTLLVAATAESDGAPRRPDLQAAESVAAESENLTCGARAAFLFGRCCGLKWTYEEVKTQLPVSDNGTSFAAIADVLHRQGVHCALRRMDPTELGTVGGPMILFLRPGYVSTQIGHFMLLESISERGPVLLDPITGASQSWRWRTFSDAWTGYALRENGQSGVGSATMQVAVVHLFVLILFLGIDFRGRARPPVGEDRGTTEANGRHPAAMLPGRSLVPVLLLCGLCLLPVSASADGEIRSLHRDGLNSALILASLTGRDSTAHQVSPDLPEMEQWSFLDIQQLCDELFCPTELRTLTYSELVTMRQPAVALLRQDDQGGGQFCVVLQADPEAATLLYSGPVVVQDLGVDEFRRRWTGHALLPVATRSPGRPVLIMATLAGGLAAFALRRRVRCDRMAAGPN